MRHRHLGIDAAVVEPGEEHAHAHQRERGREAEHDRDHDQRQHQQAKVAVGQAGPRREHDHRDGDHRHDDEAEPQLLAHLDHLACSCFTTSASSFWMSSSFTCTISFSLSTSTSCTSASREGQSPCWMQTMQRMISTIPCASRNAPASGITALNWYTGGPSAVTLECSRMRNASTA